MEKQRLRMQKRFDKAVDDLSDLKKYYVLAEEAYRYQNLSGPPRVDDFEERRAQADFHVNDDFSLNRGTFFFGMLFLLGGSKLITRRRLWDSTCFTANLVRSGLLFFGGACLRTVLNAAKLSEEDKAKDHGLKRRVAENQKAHGLVNNMVLLMNNRRRPIFEEQ